MPKEEQEDHKVLEAKMKVLRKEEGDHKALQEKRKVLKEDEKLLVEIRRRNWMFS